jgi:hypothetical protein
MMRMSYVPRVLAVADDLQVAAAMLVLHRADRGGRLLQALARVQRGCCPRLDSVIDAAETALLHPTDAAAGAALLSAVRALAARPVPGVPAADLLGRLAA